MSLGRFTLPGWARVTPRGLCLVTPLRGHVEDRLAVEFFVGGRRYHVRADAVAKRVQKSLSGNDASPEVLNAQPVCAVPA